MDLLLLIAVTLLLGFIGGKISHICKFPSVVGYIIVGVFLGPSVFHIFNLDLLHKAGIVNDFALGLIAFIIGSELRFSILRKMGKTILSILVIESIATFSLVTLGVYLFTHNIALSLILGALAVATAPAGTYVVLNEYKAKGPLTNTLLAIVGLDDGLAIIIYSCASAFAKLSINQESISILGAIQGVVIEIGGSIFLGIIFGIILSYLVRKFHNKGELLTISLIAILSCTGLANLFHLSLILSNMVLGVTMANLSLLSSRRSHEVIQNITPPIYIAFFVLAGAHLQIGLLPKMGLIGIIYITIRSLAKISGASLGAYVSKAEKNIQKYLGFGLFAQAGVAIGLAMVVAREFGFHSELAIVTVNTITATTIILEIIGPIGVKYAITKSGERGKAR